MEKLSIVLDQSQPGGGSINGNFGVPIGNVTSQIFANIYLNKLDQFAKHELKVKYYFRYADDFAIIHENYAYLENYLIKIEDFIGKKLDLRLHSGKIEIRKLSQGIDFLGYAILPHHIKMRTKTKKRMIKKLNEKNKLYQSGIIDSISYSQTLHSYLGILMHCDSYDLVNAIKNTYNLH